MRWSLRVLVLIAVLWVSYAAWPIRAVYDLVNAVQHRDSAALAQRVNFPAVRRSLTEQLVASYLQVTAKDSRLGALSRGMVVAAVTSVAEPVVAKLVTAETLIELLHDGWPTSVLPEQGALFKGLSSGSPGSAWQLFVRSEHGLRSFAFPVPVAAPARVRFKLQFRLTNWTWKLTAIELPADLRIRLAQELARQTEKK